jgi:hypothetical protein
MGPTPLRVLLDEPLDVRSANPERAADSYMRDRTAGDESIGMRPTDAEKPSQLLNAHQVFG